MHEVLTHARTGTCPRLSAASLCRLFERCLPLRWLFCFVGVPLLTLGGVCLVTAGVMYPLSLLLHWI